MKNANITFYCLIVFIISACNVLPQQIEPTATRRFSAPTLAPSPEVVIQNSDEIYGDITDGQSNPTAAALPVDAALPPLQSGITSDSGARPIQIFLENGTEITGDLYQQSASDTRSAGVLILGRDVTAWGSLPSELFSAGYTVLVLNLPDVLLAEDMDVLLTSLSENGSVDPARLVAIGAEETADMALLGCTIYPICDAVVMLSPQSRGAILNVLPSFNPRPMFIAASLNDAESYATASSIATSFADGSQFIEQSTGTGTGLLTLNSELSNFIITWLGTVWS
ncbi:MAG: hypothetical protein Phog2KO_42160 [Phototrophicaceae bacterium]